MDELTRRTLVVSAGTGAALAAARLASPAAAGEQTPAEAVNVQVVKGFCATWGAKDFDPDAAAKAFFAPDASVRMLDTMPFVVGPAAIAATFKPFLQHGERFKVNFSRSSPGARWW